MALSLTWFFPHPATTMIPAYNFTTGSGDHFCLRCHPGSIQVGDDVHALSILAKACLLVMTLDLNMGLRPTWATNSGT
ncbi:hypothetical protein MRX96_033479 [Rhipicephalus microplus]